MISGVTAGSTGNLGTDITKLLDLFIDGDSLTGSGVLDKTVGTHLAVTESGPAAMTVDVAEGVVLIKNNTATVFEKKMYIGYIDADETDIAVAANSSGVNRIDPLIVYVDLGAAAAARGVDHIFLDVLTNAETPTTAAMSDAEIQTALDIITGDSDTPWTRLADITVADSAASILDASISDTRTQAVLVCESFQTNQLMEKTTDNGILIEGMTIEDDFMAIGDTANTNMTKGMTLNQGSADDEILALKSSDVAHGVTDTAETDTYGFMRKIGADDGGVNFFGLTETSTGIRLSTIETTNNTTKSTSGGGTLDVRAYKKSGTGAGDCDSNTNLVTFRNGSTTRFLFDAEGTGHADDSWTTYSDERLKKNIEKCPYGLKELMQLKARIFDKYSGKIEDGKVILEDNGRHQIGFVAQEVEPIAPELVRKNTDGFWELDYDYFSALIVNAVQEQNERLDKLEAKLNGLA